MAKFFIQHGNCIQEKNRNEVLIEPGDLIDRFDNVTVFKTVHRNTISDQSWQTAISKSNTWIVVKKDEGICSGAEVYNAIVDISQIVDIWYDQLLEVYNKNLPEAKKYKDYWQMRKAMRTSQKTKRRFISICKLFQMTLKDVESIHRFKEWRNEIVHKSYWLIEENDEQARQQQMISALAALDRIRYLLESYNREKIVHSMYKV